jgi:hypothetical protein
VWNVRDPWPFEEAPLRLVACEVERALVGGACFAGAAEAAEELCAGGMQVLVAVERKTVDDRQ